MKPKVAIVGRPNVGKSTLFNRLIGKPKAIVDDQPGVTRDRNYDDLSWNGVDFSLIDTGGYFPEGDDQYSEYIAENVQFAAEEAEVLMLIFDGREGLVGADLNALDFLRKSGKPLLVVINKIDNVKQEPLMTEFYQCGVDKLHPISATHGHGTGDLLDALVDVLPLPEEMDDNLPEDRIKISLVGRPNVGKSTLLNSLLGEERSLVSPIPGTTRDPVDGFFSLDGTNYEIVDLAGVRRRGKIGKGVENFAYRRTKRAIDDSHVALLFIDAEEGVTETDAHVFNLVDESYKAAVIVVNKWDLIKKNTYTALEFEKKVRDKLPFLRHSHCIFVSALTGQRVTKIMKYVNDAYHAYSKRLRASELNVFLEKIQAHKAPPSLKGKVTRFYYITQVGVKPPTFVLFVNRLEAVHFSYQRYIKNQLYFHFDFKGTPVKLIIRQKKNRYVEQDYEMVEQRKR